MLIIRYEVHGNQATLWGTKEHAVYKKLIETGELQVADPGNPGDTSEPITFDSLFQYLRKNGGETLFHRATSFTKAP